MFRKTWRVALPSALALLYFGGCASDPPTAHRPIESASPPADPELTPEDVVAIESEGLSELGRAMPDPVRGPARSHGIEEILIQGRATNGIEWDPSTSVTSFDSEDLAALGVQDVSGLASFTPSLVIDGDEIEELEVVNDQPFDAMYFQHYGVNPTVDTEEDHRSTFSVDVDTASYNMARSYLESGHLPPEASIRVEEFVNAFDYGYEPPRYEVFDVSAEAFPSPNRQGYHVLHLGLKGREVRPRNRKPANLVFTIDVSGSMAAGNRLELVKRGLHMLVDELHSDDRVGIVIYGTHAAVVLEPTLARERGAILNAIDRLAPQGSTNAQAGIELAYEMAARHFEPGAINRVILCSDGVANNGIATGADGIFATVEKKAARGITISTVGFGMGNYNDQLMERLAQIGDGNYAYVDRDAEARRVFVENLTGMLQVIARDVKIQVEFDERSVSRFRLIGYENRGLAHRDFDDDRVDAGEIGAGHAVTALYEIKFRESVRDFGVVRIRFKDPEGGRSQLLERRLAASLVRESFRHASLPTQLSFVASAFAEKLRGSYWVRGLSYERIRELYDDLGERVALRDGARDLDGLIELAEKLDNRDDRYEAHLPIAQMDFDRVPVVR